MWFLTLWSLGCDPAPQSAEEALQLSEQARMQPHEALVLCQNIQRDDLKQDCFADAAQGLRGQFDTKEALCGQLSGKKRGECYFQLAEDSDRVDLCPLATPFETDCRLHILQMHCGEFSTVEGLLSYVAQIGLDIQHPNVQAITYRAMLDHPMGLRIRMCEQTPHPKSCEQLAVRLYKEQVRLSARRFPCKEPTGKLSHWNNPILLEEWTQAQQRYCTTPEATTSPE